MYTVIESSLPNFLDAESEEYDDSKVFSDGRYYLYNKKITYLKGRLDLFKESSKEVLTWILWIEVDAKEFTKFSENPNSHRGLIYAKLYSDILFYDNTKGLEVMLDFKRRDENFDPAIIFLKYTPNKELFSDFIHGINPNKYSLLLSRINQHHQKPSNN